MFQVYCTCGHVLYRTGDIRTDDIRYAGIPASPASSTRIDSINPTPKGTLFAARSRFVYVCVFVCECVCLCDCARAITSNSISPDGFAKGRGLGVDGAGWVVHVDNTQMRLHVDGALGPTHTHTHCANKCNAICLILLPLHFIILPAAAQLSRTLCLLTPRQSAGVRLFVFMLALYTEFSVGHTNT